MSEDSTDELFLNKIELNESKKFEKDIKNEEDTQNEEENDSLNHKKISKNDDSLKSDKKINDKKDADKIKLEARKNDFLNFKQNVFGAKGEKITNDRMYEMVVDSVIAKAGFLRDSSPQEEETSFLGGIASFVGGLTFLVIAGILTTLILTSFMKTGPGEKSSIRAFFGGKNEPKHSTFKYLPASDFSTIKILGMENKMKEILDDIFQKCIWVETLTKESIDQRTEGSCFNHLLYGPPGTGKTTFVKKLSYELDIKLRLAYFYHTHGGPNSKTVKDLEEKKLFARAINNMPSRVRFLFVTPSSIKDKYVGESEKNCKLLFESIDEYQGKYMATIVLFDEAEAIFEDREASSGAEGGGNSKALQSELLARLGQNPTVYRSAFIFAITNIINLFDAAFLRRLSKKHFFPLPPYKARLVIVNDVLKHANLGEKEKKLLAKVSGNKSHAFIVRTLKDGYIWGNDGEFKGYKFRDVVKKFQFPDKFKGAQF